MEAALYAEILRKCRKSVISSEIYDHQEVVEEEDIEDAHDAEKVADENVEEELPYDDILAEKRRKYTAREEFIYLLYNDMLNTIILKWDGQFIRKKPIKTIDDDKKSVEQNKNNESSMELNEEEENNFKENVEESDINSTLDNDKSFNPHWRLNLPDEYANITFVNKNVYKGRISRKMMEGEGIYRWHNGVQYKGQFECNRIQGKGLLEWNNDCWYEGDFVDGLRHGKGIMVNRETHYMYTGEWKEGQRHGTGYCRYAENDSYDGGWVMDKMAGNGLRIYPDGSRYIGQWNDGVRHGIGTMAWPNGDVYRGGWKCGEMNGYGEYIWNAFFNKSLCWPREASYVGYWRNSMRNGKGLLKLNTIGGARYTGYWKDDKKHGQGMIIGNNGEAIEADPLFLNNILVSPNSTDTSNYGNSKELNNIEENEKKIKGKTLLPVDEPLFIQEPRLTPILRPEQFPVLWYHIHRLLNQDCKKTTFARSLLSNKCYICKDNKSCSCLVQHPTDNVIDASSEKSAEKQNLMVEDVAVQKYEEQWLRNCLTLHMPRLWEIYKDYAKLFVQQLPTCNLVMSRLCLWQLWRDCGIHKKGLNLAKLDDYIAKNESSFVEDPHYPFEKLEIWQFIHALLEVAWHLYTKCDNVETVEMIGKLAGGLHRLLEIDIYPNAGKYSGNLPYGYHNLLPIYCMYELYSEVRHPPSARSLLQATCVMKGTEVRPKESPHSSTVPEYFLDGINCVTVGERISYLPRREKPLMLPMRSEDVKKPDDAFAHELLAFRELGAPTMVEIISKVCPSIKDADSGVIIDMEYELTFLEFYEILIEATKKLLHLRKEKAREIEKLKAEVEAELLRNNVRNGNTSRSAARAAVPKGSKIKKKNPVHTP